MAPTSPVTKIEIYIHSECLIPQMKDCEYQEYKSNFSHSHILNNED